MHMYMIYTLYLNQYGVENKLITHLLWGVERWRGAGTAAGVGGWVGVLRRLCRVERRAVRAQVTTTQWLGCPRSFHFNWKIKLKMNSCTTVQICWYCNNASMYMYFNPSRKLVSMLWIYWLLQLGGDCWGAYGILIDFCTTPLLHKLHDCTYMYMYTSSFIK